jgi:hypothetical protein
VSRLLYLYGFVPADGAIPPDTLMGVGDARARRIEVGGVSAVVGEVAAAEYAPEAVEARMRDLAWVGDQGALHERVVTWFVDHGGILPARLLTLYSGERALAQSVSTQAPAIREALERLRGLREWDLKISYRAEELRRGLGAVSEAVGALDREIAAAEPGRRYLLERKREKLLDEETGRAARRLGDEALEKLRPLVRDLRRMPAPRQAEAAELPVVVHAALLVEETREAELQRRAGVEGDALAAHGFTLALSGPWAAYRFIAGGEDDDGG